MVSYSTEAVLLAVVPKVPATLSIIGSSSIIYYVLTRRRKGNTVFLYHRIMLGMSCSDLVASIVYFLGTWLVPRGTEGRYGPVYLASGNERTCDVSGFLVQFAVCSPIYNGMLALYYLLLVRFKWTEQRLHKIEPLFHTVPICFGFGTSVAGLVLRLYGNVEWLCWINPNPPQERTKAYQWTFLFAPVWVCVGFVTLVMISLYVQMRALERANNRYSIGPNSSRKHERSTQIAVQGMLYVLAFYITWFFPSIQRITEFTADKNYFAVQMLDASLLPLQGLLNALIYVRPRFIRYRKKYPEVRLRALVWRTFADQKHVHPTGSSDQIGTSSHGRLEEE